ncbi:hypothetical protein HPT27_13680 [Permianibacter sp. IMCC34836]|uniref:hypothetical protein n=1 Tax=Permianibacter fluminis TaxID=2738515 RepID=UPI001551DE78|nr:hypothetical protein [Permianibacter fluminis]NQD38078.1 hypothetical protein [Permianibacter fluminis]
MSNKSPSCPHCGFSANAAPEEQDRMLARRAADRYRRQQMLQMLAVIVLMVGGVMWWFGSNGYGSKAGMLLATGQALLIGAVLLYVFARGAMLWDKFFRKS